MAVTMKALTYAGKEAIELADVAKPTLQLPTDVIVKVTLCGICGRYGYLLGSVVDLKLKACRGHPAGGNSEAALCASSHLSSSSRQ